MIKQFIKNLKKTEYYTNRILQIGIICGGIVLGLVIEMMPSIKERIWLLMIIFIAFMLPIVIYAIYNGKINED